MKQLLTVIKNIFARNTKVKAICLILSIILWVFVASNQSLLGRFPNAIPVKVNNLSEQYKAFLDQENIQVTAMAESSVWKTLTTDSFMASVNLAGYQEGTFEVDVNVISTVANVQITRVEPQKVFVSIEKIVKKSITLGTKVEGDPADGMTLGDITLNPSQVEISGPKSYIDAISEANALINLNGESASFERNVKVQAVAENDKSLSSLLYSPSEVTAKVAILKGGNNKTVGVKIKTRNSPPDGYYISKMTSTPATIDITGQRSILAGINYLETDEVDISSGTSTISTDLNLIIPNGVSLQKGASPKVRVEINFAANNASKTVSALISFQNLASGLKVASYAPEEVKVILSAPLAVLNNLTTENVKLEINLSGRNAGNYNILISQDMVKVPDGVSVLGTFPSSLTVAISD